MGTDACGWVDMMVSVWGSYHLRALIFFSRVESVATEMGEKMWEFEGRGEQMK